jgi:hypothetical protein
MLIFSQLVKKLPAFYETQDSLEFDISPPQSTPNHSDLFTPPAPHRIRGKIIFVHSLIFTASDRKAENKILNLSE